MSDRGSPTAEQLDGTNKTRVNGDGTVLHIEVARSDADEHPCGWGYSLHYGLQTGTDAPILRYDNAHELSSGHERHTLDGVTSIDFPGMVALFDRFVREYNEHRGV